MMEGVKVKGGDRRSASWTGRSCMGYAYWGQTTGASAEEVAGIS